MRLPTVLHSLAIASVLSYSACSSEKTERDRVGGAAQSTGAAAATPAPGSGGETDDEGDLATNPENVAGAWLVDCQPTFEDADRAAVPSAGEDDAIIGCAVKGKADRKKATGALLEQSLKLGFDGGPLEEVEVELAPTGSQWHAFFPLSMTGVSGVMRYEYTAKLKIIGEPISGKGEMNLDEIKALLVP